MWWYWPVMRVYVTEPDNTAPPQASLTALGTFRVVKRVGYTPRTSNTDIIYFLKGEWCYPPDKLSTF